MCIATSPSDVAAIYKETEHLSYDPFVKDFLHRVGTPLAALEKWIPDPGVATERGHRDGPNPSFHEITHVGKKLCRQQLLPGKEFDELSTKLIKDIEQSLQWHKISQNIIISSTKEMKRVSLFGWCREVMIISATRSFFSDRLFQIDPDIHESLYTFDAKSWKLFFKFPRFLAKDIDAAKDRILDTLAKYFFLPKDERKGESWLISNLEIEMIKAGITDVAEMAAIVMPLYWVYVFSTSLNHAQMHPSFGGENCACMIFALNAYIIG